MPNLSPDLEMNKVFSRENVARDTLVCILMGQGGTASRKGDSYDG